MTTLTKKFKVTLELTTEGGHPSKWDWEDVLKLERNESVRVVDVETIPSRNWQLIEYDVWGNEEAGYEVNDVYPTPTWFCVPEKATDGDLLRLLADHYGEEQVKGWEVDNSVDSTMNIYIHRSRDRYPVCELRAELED